MKVLKKNEIRCSSVIFLLSSNVQRNFKLLLISDDMVSLKKELINAIVLIKQK